MTDAVVLAGGEGTRLRPLTLSRAKPVVPVVNRPLLHYQLNAFADAGLKRAHLTMAYRPDSVRECLGDSYRGVDLLYNVEESPMGTGGAVAQVAAELEGLVLVTNGDVICDVQLEEFVRFHRDGGFSLSLLLAEVEDPSRYGVADIDASDTIREFIEKPAPGTAPSRWINGGCYLLPSEIVRSIPTDRTVSIEREIFPRLIREGVKMGGYRHGGYWLDLGTVAAYRQVHRDYLAGRWCWQDGEEWGTVLRDDATFLEKGAAIRKTARVHNSILLRDASVGGEADVEDAILADRVLVKDRVKIRGAVVGPDSTITEYSEMEA